MTQDPFTFAIDHRKKAVGPFSTAYLFTTQWRRGVWQATEDVMNDTTFRQLLVAAEDSIVLWWGFKDEIDRHRKEVARLCGIANRLEQAAEEAVAKVRADTYGKTKLGLGEMTATGHLQAIAIRTIEELCGGKATQGWRRIWCAGTGAPKQPGVNLGERLKEDYMRHVGHGRGFKAFLKAVLMDPRLPPIKSDSLKQRKKRKKRRAK